MKLPFIQSLFGKKEKKEYFLALLLRDEKVTAVIFEELAGIVRVVGKNEAILSTLLEDSTPEEWLDTFDKAISGAEETIPENVETQKTIFGIKETWVENAKIKKEFLIRLKKVSDTLGLQPIGFLVIHEAISHLLQEQEGAPVSGILIEIGQKYITVSLLRAGRVIETRQTENEDDVAQITDKLLHHFTSYEVLPSRILVLSGKKDNEKLSQSFITHVWSKSLPFLHVPQITILPKNFDAKAIISGAASQMGFELLSSSIQPAPQIIHEETTIQQPGEEGFGFIKGADIRINTIKQENLLKEENLHTEEPDKPESLIDTVIEHKHQDNFIQQKITSSIQFINNIIQTFQKQSHHEPKKKNLIIMVSILLLTLFGIAMSYFFFIKATVTIFVLPKIIEQKQDIIFSTKNPTDVDKKNIIAQAIETKKTGKITKKATGKKEIGTKAKGSITIYNKTLQSKTLSQGIIITSSNDLEFTLDSSVTIASASGTADAFSSITPSTAKTTVTAVAIGKESNLPSGTVFSIKSFSSSDVAGKNDTAFSDGTKKEVTVVSKNDISSAIEELTKNLSEDALEEMKKSIDKENNILPFISNTTFSQSSLSKKVDEEASTFTLEGTITFESLSFQEEDMQQFVKNLLGKNVDKTLIVDSTEYELQDTKKSKNNNISSTIVAKAFLLPKLEKEKLAKDITGKSFVDAKKTIEKIPQIKDVQILLKPNIPLLPRLLPKFSQNIIIAIEKE